MSATSSAEFKTALNDQMPGGYNPLKYIQLVKDAMENAKAMDVSTGWFPDFKTTQMHRLIQELMNFISINEFEDYLENKRNRGV